MPTPRTRTTILPTRRRPAPGGGGSPGPSGTGDQNAYSEHTTAWDGLESALVIGNDVVLNAGVNALSPYTSGISELTWTTVAGDRTLLYGALWLPEAATALELVAYLKGGTLAQAHRAVVYADNGTATTAMTAYLSNGAAPAARAAYGSSVTVGAAQAENWVTLPITVIDAGTLPSGLYWRGVWSQKLANDADGAALLLYSGGTASDRVRSNGTTMAYHATNAPLATYVSSSNYTTNARAEGAMYLRYTPVAPSAPTLTSATSTNRSVSLSWTNTDTRTTRVRIERSRDDGATWHYAAIVEGRTTHVDPDLEAGRSYRYRIRALYADTVSTPSNVVTVVADGVRYASSLAVFAALAASVRIENPWRGIEGRTHTLTGVAQTIKYYRQFNWVNLNPAPGVFDFSVITAVLNALGPNERAWIRVRLAVPGQGNLLAPFITDPSHYYDDPDGARYPNWNDTQVKAWIMALIDAVGAFVISEPRITGVDLGFLAQFGEGTGNYGLYTPTQDNLIAYVDRIMTAYTGKPVIIPLITNEAALNQALSYPNAAGVHQDALGGKTPDTIGSAPGGNRVPYMWSRMRADHSARIRRKLRDPRLLKVTEHNGPFRESDTANWSLALMETVGYGISVIRDPNLTNFNALGTTNRTAVLDSARLAGYRLQLTRARYVSEVRRGTSIALLSEWRNVGNAPLIESRAVAWQLRNGGNEIVHSVTSTLDLKSLLPASGALVVADQMSIPADLPTGVYTLTLHAVAGTRLLPLNLDVSGTNADASVSVGTVTVLS